MLNHLDLILELLVVVLCIAVLVLVVGVELSHHPMKGVTRIFPVRKLQHRVLAAFQKLVMVL